ncbi:DUF4232 domain-containing protein [Kitasatospora sp. NPDC051914]|uniref:DUF4232 domain-containing protein n=1 Tax=Kitasatospora sp. NPDC051914 TaxID=3154945 RepID=UPI00341C107A
MDIRRRALAAALALAAPWVLAGCTGDGADGAADTAATSAVSAAAQSASAAGTAASAAASPTSAAASAAATAKTSAKPTATPTGGSGGGGEAERCVNPWLSVTPSTSDGAAGTMVQRFVLTNTSTAPCSLQGRPSVAPYAPTGQPALAVTVGAIPAGFGNLGGGGSTLLLAPGATAAFFLKWSNVPVGDGPCPKAAGFAFRAPLDPLADPDKKVPFAFQPCGGSIQVSPVLPASATS